MIAGRTYNAGRFFALDALSAAARVYLRFSMLTSPIFRDTYAHEWASSPASFARLLVGQYASSATRKMMRAASGAKTSLRLFHFKLLPTQV